MYGKYLVKPENKVKDRVERSEIKEKRGKSDY